MASLIVRNLDEEVKTRLRLRAAKHGHSMEAEVRDILHTVLIQTPARPSNLAAALRARFSPLGGVDLPQPDRGPAHEPLELKP